MNAQKPSLGARSIARKKAFESSAGTVLVPAVIAMVVLLLAGVTLSETSASQRSHSLLDTQATRAYWIAEAGLWHAAYSGAPIASPVSFAGGSYTVSGAPSAWLAEGLYQSSMKTVDYTPSGSSGGPVVVNPGPLDVVASAATAARSSNRQLEIDLVSISTTDLEIVSFSLDSSDTSDDANRLRLENTTIWIEGTGVPVPTGTVALNRGDGNARTIPAGGSPELRIRFVQNPAGTIDYELGLFFTDGSSSLIPFTVSW